MIRTKTIPFWGHFATNFLTVAKLYLVLVAFFSPWALAAPLCSDVFESPTVGVLESSQRPLELLISPLRALRERTEPPTTSALPLKERITFSVRKLFSSPKESQFYKVTEQLARDPSNPEHKEQFLNLGFDLVYRFHDFHKIAKAHDYIFYQKKRDKLSLEDFDLLITFLQKSHWGLLHHPHERSPAHPFVQDYFSRHILHEIKSNPSFSGHDAVRLFLQLEESGIYFSNFTKDGKWVPGNIHAAIVKAGKDTQPVEELIVQSTRKLKVFSEWLRIIAGLEDNLETYQVSDFLLFRIKENFYEWVRNPANLRQSDYEIDLTKSKMNIDFLSQHAKRVITFREFIADVHDISPRAVALGISDTIYLGITRFKKILPFDEAYHKFFMSPSMVDISKEEQIQKTRMFMKRLVRSHREIVFLLPSNPKKTFFTKTELDYLMEDPARLSNVTFVLGANIE